MTREQLEKRKAELTEQHQAAITNRDNNQRMVDALSGAIQDCDFWLAGLEEAEKKAAAADSK